MRVLSKCIKDVRLREIEECKKLHDNQAEEKVSKVIEESVVDPVQIASMLVKDNNLFLEPKRPENSEKEEF